jgi:hypothetical protein
MISINKRSDLTIDGLLPFDEVSKMNLCTRCHIEKPEEEFHKHPDHRSGLQSWCKTCQREYKRLHPEKSAEQNKRYYASPIGQAAIFRNISRIRSNEAFDKQGIEVFDKQNIFERDGWRCSICGKEVNKKLLFPNPQSASLDHIISIHYGGMHEPKNVRLAHLVCNQRKPRTKD